MLILAGHVVKHKNDHNIGCNMIYGDIIINYKFLGIDQLINLINKLKLSAWGLSIDRGTVCL